MRVGRGTIMVTVFIIIFIKATASQICLNQQTYELDHQPNFCAKFDEAAAAAIGHREVGGAPIKSTDAPWHTIVALEGVGELNIRGGGSLITPRLVLTAAHLFWTNYDDGRVCPKYARDLQTAEECHGLKGGCPTACYRVTSDRVRLYFGVTSMDEQLPAPYTIDIIEFHPGWNKQSISNDLIDGHDMAIVRTNQNVEFSQTVQPVCLPNPELELELLTAGTGTSINGFGRDGKNGDMLATNLQQGCLFLVKTSTCREAYRPVARKNEAFFPQGELTGDQLCARGDGVDSCQVTQLKMGCFKGSSSLWNRSQLFFALTFFSHRRCSQGDSGGGLVVNREGRSLLVGVTSLGSTSCRTSLPGLYTNIFSHLPWIQQQMSTDQCLPWSACSASCSSPGQKVRTCSKVLEDGRPWFQDETRSCTLSCEGSEPLLLGGQLANPGQVLPTSQSSSS